MVARFARKFLWKFPRPVFLRELTLTRLGPTMAAELAERDLGCCNENLEDAEEEQRLGFVFHPLL